MLRKWSKIHSPTGSNLACCDLPLAWTLPASVFETVILKMFLTKQITVFHFNLLKYQWFNHVL
jgi:hypothetical protein